VEVDPDTPATAARESVPESSETTAAPAVEETTTTSTTVPPSLPPVNPVWLQVGGRRATVNGEPGATAPAAGRTPQGTRQAPVDEVDVVLATIRTLESANQYGIGPNKASASGAYQYIRSTWNGYGGYSDAYLAPAEVQDARARADVQYFLDRFNGNVSMIPVMWYYPRAATDTTWMDRVPNPAGGNRLTVREYQTKWVNLYQQYRDAYVATYTPPPEQGLASVVASDARVVDPQAAAEPGSVAVKLNDGTTDQDTLSWAARAAPAAMPAAPVDGSYRSLVFPVLGPVTYEDGWGACRDGCARSHVGTDIIGVQMQPLLAAVDGTITRISPVATGISGVAISITGPDGWRYNYFHVNNDTPGTDDGAALQAWEIAPGLQVGSTVRAGQIIGYMGNSGNAEASTTHLHFEIRDPAGVAQPSYASLKAAEAVQACAVGIGPWSTPTLGPGAAANAEAEAAAQAEAAAAAAATDPNAPAATTTVAPVETATLGPDGQPIVAPEPGFPGATVPPAVEFVDPVSGVAATASDVTGAPGTVGATAVSTTATTSARPVLARTVVTPLFGSGQWTIDTDGRVTATGDAALIVPGRDLACADGPTVPYGTDAAGWTLTPDDSVLRGTNLEGVDLQSTVIQGVLPAAQTDLVPAATDVVDPYDVLGLATAPTTEPPAPYAAHAFRMPSTGETILLLFPNF
jgi:murein DD-endopeptidase MepM/ murein hydrolase activator NlpD